MEYNQLDHHNSDTNVILLTFILLFNFIKDIFTPELINILQGIAVIMLIIINIDKLYDVMTKWYLRITSWFKKK